MRHLLVKLLIKFGHFSVKIVLSFLQKAKMVVGSVMHVLGYQNLFLVVFVFGNDLREQLSLLREVLYIVPNAPLGLIDLISVAFMVVYIGLTLIVIQNLCTLYNLRNVVFNL